MPEIAYPPEGHDFLAPDAMIALLRLHGRQVDAGVFRSLAGKAWRVDGRGASDWQECLAYFSRNA